MPDSIPVPESHGNIRLPVCLPHVTQVAMLVGNETCGCSCLDPARHRIYVLAGLTLKDVADATYRFYQQGWITKWTAILLSDTTDPARLRGVGCSTRRCLELLSSSPRLLRLAHDHLQPLQARLILILRCTFLPNTSQALSFYYGREGSKAYVSSHFWIPAFLPPAMIRFAPSTTRTSHMHISQSFFIFSHRTPGGALQCDYSF